MTHHAPLPTPPGQLPESQRPQGQRPQGQRSQGQGLFGAVPVLGLDWLLEGLRERVPGIAAAVLTSRDGMKLAVAGLSSDQADPVAALVCSLLAMARSTGAPVGWSGGVRQVVVEHDDGMLFVMATGAPPPATPQERPPIVDSVLGVLATPQADPRLVGHELAALAASVTEHLVTATRNGGAPTGGGQ